MEAKAISKMNMISADKARLVIDLVRGKQVSEALAILNNMNQKAAKLIKKTLVSACANATNNHEGKKEDLFISKAYINEGPVLKRMKFDSRSHIGRKDKRTSHITIYVSDEK